MSLTPQDYESVLLSIARMQLNNETVAAYLMKTSEVLGNLARIITSLQQTAPAVPDYSAERAAVSPEAAALASDAIARIKGL
jgi:hypothetical protein